VAWPLVFGAILLLFFIPIPIFVAWNFISPRTFREFNYGTRPVFVLSEVSPSPGRFCGPIRYGRRYGMKVPSSQHQITLDNLSAHKTATVDAFLA